jgi:capsular exopolysaccharide synthesis family protein
MNATPTTSSPRPGAGAPRPPQAAGAAGGATLDPLKILQKYKFVLVASLVVGAIVGLIGHILLMKFAPRYTSHVIFDVKPAEADIYRTSVSTVDETEMDRFMGSQAETMKSKLVLSKVVADSRLPQLAPKWSSDYMSGGRIDIVESLDDLQGMVSANIIPKTFYIRMAVTTSDRNDAAGLVSLVKETYLAELDSRYKRDVVSRRTAIRDSIQAADSQISELTARKTRLVREERIDSINSESSTTAGQMNMVNARLVEIQQSLEALQVVRAKDEAQLQRETGIEYDSSLRAEVELLPLMQTFKQELKSFETALLSLKNQGIQPGHRSYKQISNQIEAHERKIAQAREELLRERFEAKLQQTVTTIAQLRAQEADLLTQKEELEEKLTELTRISEEIADIDRLIQTTIERKGSLEQDLSELQAASALTSAQRVTVVESETIPDFPSFPKLIIMIPAGVILIMGLTGGVIVAFEMLDQRIKSASDIRMIPRLNPLGIVMDASEDPVKIAAVATAFRDAPDSVFSEYIRQLRATITKRMDHAGYTTLLVCGVNPGSGSSAITANLGIACVATGIKTLIIDANMRRPRIAESLGLEPGKPGVSDILMGKSDFAQCVRTVEDGPDVLGAGTKELRQIERLGSQDMRALLAKVSAEYDLVLVDIAPAIVAGDATVLANQCDASALIVRAMSAKRGQVARVARELGECRAEFLGAVVNGVKSAAGGYMRKNIRESFAYLVNPDEKNDKDGKDKDQDKAA